MKDGITVYASNNVAKIVSYSKFFDDCEYYSIDDDGIRIIIEKHRLDTGKNSRKVNKTYKAYGFTLRSEIPSGKYPFCEEESNEDIAVIYYA